MNGIKLEKIRKEIDRVDHKLLNLIGIRTKLVKKITKIKKSKKQIVDKKRITLVLKNIRRKSIKKGINPDITNKIWQAIIRSYIKFEKKIFKKNY